MGVRSMIDSAFVGFEELILVFAGVIGMRISPSFEGIELDLHRIACTA
jgi:hypothetical protein